MNIGRQIWLIMCSSIVLCKTLSFVFSYYPGSGLIIITLKP
jgi:hypothetical protein